MEKKELNASNFMPEDLLEIICILERGEKQYLYKIICKRNSLSGSRNKSSPHASRSASQHTDVKHKDSFRVWLAQLMPKKKSSAPVASQHTDMKH